MIRDVHPRSGSRIPGSGVFSLPILYPGSGGQKGTGSRIQCRNTVWNYLFRIYSCKDPNLSVLFLLQLYLTHQIREMCGFVYSRDYVKFSSTKIIFLILYTGTGPTVLFHTGTGTNIGNRYRNRPKNQVNTIHLYYGWTSFTVEQIRVRIDCTQCQGCTLQINIREYVKTL